MTNLFEFLQSLLDRAREDEGRLTLAAPERVFLETFLRAPDVELHFRATHTGKIVDTPTGPLPEMVTNYVVRGEPVEIFELLSDAALQNPGIFRLCEGVSGFMREHVGTCESCRAQVEACDMADPGPDFWKFSPPNHPR